MIVDCMTCPVRGRRCDSCAITVLRPPGWAQHLSAAEPTGFTELELDAWDNLALDASESRAVSVFVGAGLLGADAAARLRARRERLQPRESLRDAG